MNKPSEKKPILRFANFNDAWEQRKFDEITFPAGIRNKDNLPLEPYSITNDRGFLPQNEAHDDFGYMQNTDRKAYIVVSPNSFGYNPARINVGSIGYYEDAENVIVSSLYEIFKTQDYIDDHFLMHWFKSDLFPRWIEKFQEGSVRQYFYYDKLCECSLTFPSIDEQCKISSLIDSIDTTITLHQRKLEQQKAVKKSMLQKLFPSENMLTPQFRFSGFSDDWKQYKLKDLLTFQNGFNGSQELFGEGVALISVMDILNNPFITYDVIRSKASVSAAELERYAVRYGDVLFQRSSENVEDAGSTNVYIDADKTAVFGGFVIRGKQKYPYSPKFMKYLLDTKAVRNQITRCAQGAQHINVSQETLQDITVTLPTQTEQRKIESFLFDIDELIISRQRWLDLLLKMKKALLQKMFV